MVPNKLSSPDSSSTWTAKQNKSFENALAIYDQETLERWHKIAKIVGGTTEEVVKMRYQILEHDIKCIESGRVPLPKYKKVGESNISNNENRMMCSESNYKKATVVKEITKRNMMILCLITLLDRMAKEFKDMKDALRH